LRSELDESWGGKSIFVHFHAKTEQEEAKDLRLKERKNEKLEKFLREVLQNSKTSLAFSLFSFDSTPTLHHPQASTPMHSPDLHRSLSKSFAKKTPVEDEHKET
jgi:2,3-bisphosphoglycerate-independent phosphoglycerate mutase